MGRTHTKAATGGATGHDGSPEAGYNVRGRRTGGRLHQKGARKWKPAEAPPVMASKAVVVHLEKQEIALEAKIVAAIARAEELIAAHCVLVANKQWERLEAASNITPFVSAAEGTRARLVAAGVIS